MSYGSDSENSNQLGKDSLDQDSSFSNDERQDQLMTKREKKESKMNLQSDI